MLPLWGSTCQSAPGEVIRTSDGLGARIDDVQHQGVHYDTGNDVPWPGLCHIDTPDGTRHVSGAARARNHPEMIFTPTLCG